MMGDGLDGTLGTGTVVRTIDDHRGFFFNPRHITNLATHTARGRNEKRRQKRAVYLLLFYFVREMRNSLSPLSAITLSQNPPSRNT